MLTQTRLSPMILDETSPLQQVMVWGEPGVESLLGQLLPKSKSLFRNYYEVPRARREFRHMQALLEGQGIDVIRAKDAVVRMLESRVFPSIPGRMRELKSELLERASQYYQQYSLQKARELESESSPLGVTQFKAQVLRDIDSVLDEDVASYGEVGAIRLNYLLSLMRAWPLANIFYARDQSQVIANKIVLSSFQWQIRRPEVRIFEDAFYELGLQESIVQVGEGTLEGGDLSMFNGSCFIGVGARTSLAAVMDICAKLAETLNQYQIELLAIVNEQHVAETDFYVSPTSEHMQVMHLDMFWIPLSPKLVLAYAEEMDQRQVIRIRPGAVLPTVEHLGCFKEFLNSRNVEVLEVNRSEQQNFATNLLNLGNNKLMVALSSNPRVNVELQKRGFELHFAELEGLVGGYGAVHCLTAPLKRSV